MNYETFVQTMSARHPVLEQGRVQVTSPPEPEPDELFADEIMVKEISLRPLNLSRFRDKEREPPKIALPAQTLPTYRPCRTSLTVEQLMHEDIDEVIALTGDALYVPGWSKVGRVKVGKKGGLLARFFAPSPEGGEITLTVPDYRVHLGEGPLTRVILAFVAYEELSEHGTNDDLHRRLEVLLRHLALAESICTSIERQGAHGD